MGGGKGKEVCLLVVYNYNLEQPVLDLRKAFPDVTFIVYDSRADAIPEDVWKKTNYLVTMATFPPSLDLVPNLKWVHICSAGIDRIVKHPIYTSTDIIITNSSGIHGPQIAEWALMNMLVARRKYNTTYELQKAHRWDSSKLPQLRDHVGERIGILGYGSIGRQVARLTSSLGMTVLAYTSSPRPTPSSRRDTRSPQIPGTGDPDGLIPSAWYSGTSRSSLHTFLSQSLDYLLISVPLTAQTRHLISTRELEIMSAGAGGDRHGTFLINISRGPIVDTDALLSALNSPDGSGIPGAALDVTDPEPLPPDHPLWDARNVFISPHVSGRSDVYMDRCLGVVFRGNLERYRGDDGDGGEKEGEKEKAERMWNVVDRGRGY